jgi:hypothetical protein
MKAVHGSHRGFISGLVVSGVVPLAALNVVTVIVGEGICPA